MCPVTMIIPAGAHHYSGANMHVLLLEILPSWCLFEALFLKSGEKISNFTASYTSYLTD